MAPGYVDTDILSSSDGSSNAEYVKKWTEMTPIGRFAKPSEIGEMIVLMLSDKASSFMTGHEVVMDGGTLPNASKRTKAKIIFRVYYILMRSLRWRRAAQGSWMSTSRSLQPYLTAASESCSRGPSPYAYKTLS